MLKKVIKSSLCTALMMFSATTVYGANVNPAIMYIPQDNRPISYNQTIDAVATTGLKVIAPEEKLLGNRENPKGHTLELGNWAKNAAKEADVAVIASDALLYGSLVASRQEDHHKEQVLNNVKVIKELKDINPNLKIYVFGSIMRTPQSIQASGGTDAALYAKYGNDIAKYTALLDKEAQGKLNHKDKAQLKLYAAKIPKEALDTWLKLREANLAASFKLIDYTKAKYIDYLALGADDNAPFSQTNKERRSLDNYAKQMGLNSLNYASVAGIDELGYVLLTRGTNYIKGDIPFVKVYYGEGVGKDTIPAYSNETIAKSVATHVSMAKGMEIKYSKPDVVLMVNTKYDGTTGAANNPDNKPVITPYLSKFVDRVADFVKAGYNVSIADIAYGNGGDNGLMAGLYEKGLLGKLGGYAGWNTPTNSSGFALAMGMNANYMKSQNNMSNLATRYLDDWLYEANVRQNVANQLANLAGEGAYMNLAAKKAGAEQLATEDMRKLVIKYNLAKTLALPNLAQVKLNFPWNRMFETNIVLPKE